jgi:predicted RNase H-like HicB family nuclease
LTAPARSADELGKRAAPEVCDNAHRSPYRGVVVDTPDVELVFEAEEEGGYHVHAPALPGLHTQGESLDEAFENAREAIALYAEQLLDDT